VDKMTPSGTEETYDNARIDQRTRRILRTMYI